MKIDLNTAAPVAQYKKSTQVQIPTQDSTATDAATVDRTTFHSGPASVKGLVDNALATPDVRQDKVASIKQAISNGTYKFDAGKVADAMIANSKMIASSRMA